jgi:hypothetical protein
MKNKISVLLVGVLGLHLIFLVFLKFTAWPEMLLWPYMMIQGLLPYKDIAIAHTPHLIADLAVFFKIFGVGILQLKIYTWLLIIATDLIVYWVSDKLWNRKIAIIFTFSFIVLQIFFDGNGLWFDSLLVPFSVVLFYLVSKKNYFWTGIIWAVMFLTKQTAVWFLIPVGLTLVKNLKFNNIPHVNWQELKKFTFGALIVIVSFILILWVFGILSYFYQWAINFGIFVLPRAQGQIQLPDLKNLIVAGFPFVIIILFLLNKNRNFYLLIWMIAGSMGAYPRFEYFHFQPALPFLAIIIGIVMYQANKNRLVNIFLVLYLLGFSYLFANYFMRNWKEGTRFLETDVADIVFYVKNNTHENEKIFVLNWWDNIYPLTRTIPATDPWIPQLSWYQDLPGIQEKEIESLKTIKPKLILFNEYESAGLAAYKPRKLGDYIDNNYELKEKINGISILVLKK